MSLKQRLKRLEGKIRDGYQETLDYLTLSWKTTNRATPWPDPAPEMMLELKTWARELVNRGKTLSIRGLLKKIDGRGLPRPVIAEQEGEPA